MVSRWDYWSGRADPACAEGGLFEVRRGCAAVRGGSTGPTAGPSALGRRGGRVRGWVICAGAAALAASEVGLSKWGGAALAVVAGRTERTRVPSSLAGRDERAARGADVVRAGPDQAVVVVLLDDVGGPAGDAAGRDDGREEVHRDAERVEQRRRVEVDVRDEPLGGADPLMQLHRHLVPLELARLPTGLLGHPAQDGGTRVAGLVDAVTEAHEAPLLGEGLLREGVHVLHLADLHERAHHRLSGATVQRTLQGADAAGHRGMHVRLRGDDGAGRERRGVQLVLGIEGEARVEGLHGRRARALPGEHVQEVGAVAQPGGRRYRLLSAADAMMRAD